MPRFCPWGYPVLEYRGVVCVRRRRGQWLPMKVKRYVWACAHYWRIMLWQPGRGMWQENLFPRGHVGTDPIQTSVPPKGRSVKRRSPMTGEGVPLPVLSLESTILKKLPLLREFLTATAYDDGSIRQPGYFWFLNDGPAFSLHLFDVDACARLVLRAPTFDETFALAETALGMENAPWLPDRFLAARQEGAKKPRRKGA